MRLELSSDDRKLLEHVLEQALSEMRVEVRRTTTPRYHDDMRIEEGHLKQLLEKLKALES